MKQTKGTLCLSHWFFETDSIATGQYLQNGNDFEGNSGTLNGSMYGMVAILHSIGQKPKYMALSVAKDLFSKGCLTLINHSWSQA